MGHLVYQIHQLRKQIAADEIELRTAHLQGEDIRQVMRSTASIYFNNFFIIIRPLSWAIFLE
jgi:hypothetical protein